MKFDIFIYLFIMALVGLGIIDLDNLVLAVNRASDAIHRDNHAVKFGIGIYGRCRACGENQLLILVIPKQNRSSLTIRDLYRNIHNMLKQGSKFNLAV